MKKYIPVIFLFFIVINLTGQTDSKIDSLLRLLNDSKEDTTTVILLNNIAQRYCHSNPDSTFSYAAKALKISNDINYAYGKAKAYRMIGLGYSAKSNSDEALRYYFLSLNEFKKIGKTDDVAIVLTSIGIVYRKKDDYESALRYYLKSLKIIKLGNDSTKIAAAYTNVGIIYKVIKDYDMALKYHQQSLDINRKIGNKEGLPFSLGNIALTYKAMGKYDIAITYLKEALEIFEEFNYLNEIGHTYSAMGAIYLIQKKYQEAFNCIQISNKIYSETGHKAGIAQTYIILGNLYLNQGMYNASESALSLGMGIAKEIGSKEYLMDSYLYFSKLDSAKNNYKSALDYYKKYTDLKDSIFSKEKNETISVIQGKYDTAEKERENILLRKDKEINEMKLRRQKLLNYSVGFVLLLMFVVGFMIIFSYKKLKKANLLLESKNEEISIQNISLEEYKEEIESQYEEIRIQNESLEIYKNKLEKLVDERTKKLNEALILAQESDHLKTQFLENLSHEVRTPMNAISGFSTILAKDKFNFKPEYLYGIHKGMDDLVNTIDRLVIFSKFQVEQYSIDPERIKLETYFGKLKKRIIERKDFLKKDAVNIEFDIDFKKLPEFFVSDEFVLNSIIKELIENSLKFTDKGSIVINAYIVNENRLFLKVKDTGVGINEDLISKVYDFMRKFDKEDAMYRGMGVGLALVQKAVEILSGEIMIDSAHNEGAELTIIIPEYKSI